MENGRIHIESPKRKQPSRRWGIWLLVPLLAVVVVLCLFSWEWKDSLKIQRVIVTGARILTAQQIFTLAGVPSSAPMYEVDLFKVRQRILTQPFIKSATVSRAYPNVLRVDVVERIPIASLSGGQLRYIDTDGMVLPFVQSPAKLDLPVVSGINGIQNARVGDTIVNDELTQAIRLLETTQRIDSSLYHFVSEVNMNAGGDIILYSTDAGVPIILGRDKVGRKLLTLQSFWTDFVRTDSVGRLRQVDLRFEDQVVVKWQNGSEEKRSSGATSM
jgi:cell division septal protein FtsQ